MRPNAPGLDGRMHGPDGSVLGAVLPRYSVATVRDLHWADGWITCRSTNGGSIRCIADNRSSDANLTAPWPPWPHAPQAGPDPHPSTGPGTADTPRPQVPYRPCARRLRPDDSAPAPHSDSVPARADTPRSLHPAGLASGSRP